MVESCQTFRKPGEAEIINVSPGRSTMSPMRPPMRSPARCTARMAASKRRRNSASRTVSPTSRERWEITTSNM